MSDKIIELKDLRKSFGNNEVLKGIDLSVEKGEVISIIGSSGSGKSTLLRCINQLEEKTAGDILYHGTSIFDKSTNLSEYRAKVGMVFQQFNLFNNMNVLKNCTIGQIKVLKRNKVETTVDTKYTDRHGLPCKGRNGKLNRCKTVTAIGRTEAESCNCKNTCNVTRGNTF